MSMFFLKFYNILAKKMKFLFLSFIHLFSLNHTYSYSRLSRPNTQTNTCFSAHFYFHTFILIHQLDNNFKLKKLITRRVNPSMIRYDLNEFDMFNLVSAYLKRKIYISFCEKSFVGYINFALNLYVFFKCVF